MAQFLLERAFNNKRIGHYLFWNLRAEVDSPENNLRFGLLLESYLRGSPNHLSELQRQVSWNKKYVYDSHVFVPLRVFRMNAQLTHLFCQQQQYLGIIHAAMQYAWWLTKLSGVRL